MAEMNELCQCCQSVRFPNGKLTVVIIRFQNYVYNYISICLLLIIIYHLICFLSFRHLKNYCFIINIGKMFNLK